MVPIPGAGLRLLFTPGSRVYIYDLMKITHSTPGKSIHHLGLRFVRSPMTIDESMNLKGCIRSPKCIRTTPYDGGDCLGLA